MATLTGNTIASTYTGLLSVTGAVGADTVEAVTDGAGTSTSLSLSQQRATITLGSGAADDFIVDGTTLVVEGDNNRVGIGTASPSTGLHLSGGDNTASKLTLTNTAPSPDNSWSLHPEYNSQNLTLSEDSTTRITFQSGGNVGIGHTTPQYGLTMAQGNADAQKIGWEDGSNNKRGAILVNSDNDAMEFMTGTSDSVRMTITSDGELILKGTSLPEDFGDEKGQLAISSADNASANNYAVLQLQGHSIANSVGTGGIYFYDHSNNVALIQANRASSESTSNLLFYTNGGSLTENMRITSAGKLIAGGGTAEGSHSERLGVKCLSRYGIFVSDNMSSGTTTIMRMYDTNASAVVGSITSTSSGTAFNTSSDYRLKENEVVISDGLTRLNQLKPYRFNFKTDTDTTVDGFFAHEVSEVVPEAITGEKDAVDNDGNIVSQGIDQSKLVPLLVKAVQELSAKVEALENA